MSRFDPTVIGRPILSLVTLVSCLGCGPAKQPLPTTITGRVTSDDGPVAEARVRVRGTDRVTVTDSLGRFRLSGVARSSTLTAAHPAFFIQGRPATSDRIEFQLTRLPEQDFTSYEWVDPSPDATSEHNCANCHAGIFREWQASGHAHSASNRRLLSLYNGTDWHGQEQRGWSLAADHPAGRTVCSACHAPAIDIDDAAVDDMNLVSGVAAHGVHCDFCHKIQSGAEEITGLAHGRFGVRLLRPRAGQLFFGPLDDVDRGEDVYLPLQQESRFCASCHEGIVFGVHVYSTWSEWLDSPARRNGQSCQSCHMQPNGTTVNIAEGNGGIDRDPRTLGSHDMLPGGRESMLRRCLKLTIDRTRDDRGWSVSVRLRATNVGHRVPTGFIDRHLLLILDAVDGAGNRVPADAGPQLPELAEPFGGCSGRMFGRVASDADGHVPAAFWNAVDEPIDTRLKPETEAVTRFDFPPAARSLRVRVVYRRFWRRVALEKRWPDDTIVVHDRSLDLTGD